MPEARKLVDVEALLVAYLATDGPLGALVDDAIGTELPRAFPSTGAPRVQAFRASGTTVDPATGHLDRALVQVNAYGSSKAEAWDVFAETYRALLAARAAEHEGAVVTDVERVSGPTWSPDPQTDAPRYVGSFAVTVHPAP